MEIQYYINTTSSLLVFFSEHLDHQVSLPKLVVDSNYSFVMTSSTPTTSQNGYLGNANTQTLNRVEVLPLEDVNEPQGITNTPSLSETKIAKVKLPSEMPRVPRLKINDLTLGHNATTENVASMLEKYGVCIVKGFLNETQLNNVEEELEPHFERQKNDPRLFPKETIRVTSTVSKSPAVVKEVLAHPMHVELTKKFLDQKNAFWIGENINIGLSQAIVSSSIAFKVGPGAQGQAIHRDDMSDHNIRKHQESYTYGSDSQFGVSVALNKITKDNGGTKFIPGSHLWDHLRQPHEADEIFVEMERGDAFFMLASVFHGAGSNITESEYRTLLILFMCKGTLRQKENIYLETPIEYFKQFDELELLLLGLSMSEPFSGMLELRDPLVVLKDGYVRKSNYSDICKVSPIM